MNPDLGPDINAQNDITGKPVKRIEAILCIWSFANLSEEKREEIFKTGCGPNILSLVDRGDVEDKFAIMGAISALAQSDKHGHEVISNKVISCAANMLMGDHARSKLPAASLLANLALRAEYSGRVADVALVPLASILKENGPGWAQTQQLQVQVATAIKSLIENIVV
ncbi:hypothetical protein CEUSTIGMA_g7742.t1 [Chlamydomonas eustigma]|uniref:Uncharacterized protein n=1 Tax=Chlamydomonas eustigma TaxID=1157962 RepID=A0A250XB61_9CHLO|nr:hypothetical protein CEUSTIGMA_g7742.t1 [Chlamydomonas eustigma]|eukprot:GAX80304.1 hypothetical protein CEUSTIGMA_g7742.t1 [Chlamydomonas eustigma]